MPAPKISSDLAVERLERGQEYRFEVDFDARIDISLRSGHAEIFGTEITVGPTYSFTGAKGAVYSWQGCELEIKGTPSASYISDESPMMAYLNCHFALARLREEAGQSEAGGPRVLVIGPDDAGKTSLIKILASYAIKQGHQPLLVNLDPREGMSTVPGTLSAMPLTSVLDVVDGFGNATTTGMTELAPRIPLSYCFGSDSPTNNVKYYKLLMSRLASAAASRATKDAAQRQGGMLIDSSGLIDQTKGYDLIQAAVSEFNVNVIITLDSERLYSDMSRKYDGKDGLSVLKLPKSGGVVGRDSAFVRGQQQAAFRKYFNGDARQALSPFSLSVQFSDLKLKQVEEAGVGVNHSLLPIGAEQQTSSNAHVATCEPSSLLLHSMITMVQAESHDSAEVVSQSSVLCHLVVTDVDDAKQKMTLLCPFQGRLPNKALIATSFKFLD
ncbi:Pre-mRNA cleavage complex II protein Clp1-domain-containing protein [Protomyces lactucae-debilis]|uniref:Polynucleotide 5'-hydroxyl-kinase GRC3 n=1 Tax=Protomyces lactucae-debilis TaxID=2754530 RepID=A0A1Y2FNW9_PROLT|nr:Pre-mRNA cleavage complex II protein Clp1-domain-containing protein [Protomyces lactucae-debilis]ORY85681.1 Pre-mRNA cleavage complex II protein Clp1-domain-containing protein [Protomyces lactucae-debilis]